MMELLQLRYFCDAAECENFSATAKKFFVPPSAVSQSIKRLEQELETALFIRRANRIYLSDRGAQFYAKVKDALSLLEDAKNQVRDDGVSGKVKLSIFINRRIVMETVERFSKAFPQAEIITKYNVSPDREDFDLIITDTVPGNSPFHRHPLLHEDSSCR